MLTVRLFGKTEFELHGARLVMTSKKNQALLAILAENTGTPVRRDKLAEMLWPNSSIESSRANFRQCLSTLRKNLQNQHNHLLIANSEIVTLDENMVNVDTTRFNKLLRSGTQADLEEALQLYRGEFLEDFVLDENEFLDWQQLNALEYRKQYLALLDKLAEAAARQHDLQRQVVALEKLLSASPSDESAARRLMKSHLQTGRRLEALQVYTRLKHELESTFDATPEVQTTQLYRQIVNGRLCAPAASEWWSNLRSETATPGNYRYLLLPLLLPLLLLITGFFALIHQTPREVTSEPSLSEPGSPGHDSVGIDTVLPRLQTTLSGVLGSINEKPALAVLPFDNLSANSEHNYFSDGLTEDIITELTRVSDLTVVARNSSFLFRDSIHSPAAIGKALNVQYLVTGSVRKAGDSLRISVQLVEAASSRTLWATRHDRKMLEVLQVQSEIAQDVAGQLSVKLAPDEKILLDRVTEINSDAYELLLQSLGPLRHLTLESNREARALLQQSIKLDPNYARAHANLALAYSQGLTFNFSDQKNDWIQLAEDHINFALKLDDTLPQTHFTASVYFLSMLKHDKALESARLAIHHDSGYADGYGTLAQILMFMGHLSEARKAIEIAKRLNPKFTFTYLWVDGQIDLLNGDYRKALATFTEINYRNPAFLSGRLLKTVALSHLDKREEAEWEREMLLAENPAYTIAGDRITKYYVKPEHRQIYVNGLKLAGFE